MDIRGILGIEMEDGPRDGLELLLEERFMELAQVRIEKDPEGKERYKELEMLVLGHHPGGRAAGESFLDSLTDQEEADKEDFYLLGIKDGIRVARCFGAI